MIDNSVEIVSIQPGTELTAKHFRVGDHVIVEGRTIGRGYEGVMIRWGYKGKLANRGRHRRHFDALIN